MRCFSNASRFLTNFENENKLKSSFFDGKLKRKLQCACVQNKSAIKETQYCFGGKKVFEQKKQEVRKSKSLLKMAN